MRRYRAPEILVGSDKYGAAVDVWSLGCIFGEMLGGRPVFSGSSTLNQIEKVVETIGFPAEAELTSWQSTFARTMLESISSDDKAPIERRVPSGGSVRAADRVILDKDGEPLLDAETGEALVQDERAVLVSSRWRENYNAELASDDAIDLLCCLLRYNPDERIVPLDGMVHPYCVQFHDPETEVVWEGPKISNPMDDNTKKPTKVYREELYERSAKAEQEKLAAMQGRSRGAASRR